MKDSVFRFLVITWGVGLAILAIWFVTGNPTTPFNHPCSYPDQTHD